MYSQCVQPSLGIVIELDRTTPSSFGGNKGNKMVKPAFVTEDDSRAAAMRTAGKSVEERLQTTMNSSNGRFPPVENALTEIIKNKRLSEAHQNV